MSRRHLRKALQSSFLFSALILLASATSWARPKIDVLIMNNGDHITCEIVRLEKGYLFVKLPYGDGTVSLDWAKVLSVDSPQQFVFTDQNGRRYSGTLQKLAVKAEQSEEQVPNERAAVADIKKVVEIQPYNAGFWRNQHGSIDFGLSFAKQSSRTQYSLTANDAYIRQKWSVRGDFASSLATGGGSDTPALSVPKLPRNSCPETPSVQSFVKIDIFGSFLRLAAQRERTKGFFFREKPTLRSGTEVNRGT